MDWKIISGVLALSVLFSIFNGFVINWKLNKNNKDWSVRWHGTGLFIHAIMVAMLYLAGGWIWGLVGLVTVWLLHNIIIALLMGQRWFYVGKTAWFDRQIRKIFKFINFDKG